MNSINTKELLEAGVHFGHLRKKWNPKMRPFIFMERKGIHIIDLNKTQEKLQEAAAAMKSIARSGKKILFVATKKQAKELVTNAARSVDMPYMTERWPGGMLTNFSTIRKSIKKMQAITKMLSEEPTEKSITKKERLILTRERDKMERVLGGVKQLNRIPSAIFIVDISNEHIALAESRNLNITTFALVDTNSAPTKVHFPIPANDDATKSVAIITDFLTQAVKEGLKERKLAKEEADAVQKEQANKKSSEPKPEKEVESKPKKRIQRKRKSVHSVESGTEAKNKNSETAKKKETETKAKPKDQK